MHRSSPRINTGVHADDIVRFVVRFQTREESKVCGRHRIEEHLVPYSNRFHDYTWPCGFEFGLNGCRRFGRVARDCFETADPDPRMSGWIFPGSQHVLLVIAEKSHNRARRFFSRPDDAIHAPANVRPFIDIVTEKNEDIFPLQSWKYLR